MKNNRNIKLKSYDDIFNITEKLPENDIKDIDVNLLADFRDHPFKIVENKEMVELYESIKENGILVPVLVRPIGEKYEIISGHRRKYCAIRAELKTVPCLIKEMEYDDAVFVMLDSNIQRKNILPSEKAFSYKMKLNAIKRQGERGDLTSRQVGEKLNGVSADLVGESFNESGRSVHRYIRLTELTPFLLEAVDRKKMSFGAGVEVSYLSKEEQELLEEAIKELRWFPALAQAKSIRDMAGNLNESNIKLALIGNKEALEDDVSITREIYMQKGELGKNSSIIIQLDRIKQYFPPEFTADDIEKAIIDLLEKNEFAIK